MRLVFAAAVALAAAGAQAAEMQVFKQPNFTGDSITLSGEMRDLSGRGFQDQISSIQVRSGRWQVCTQPNFAGDCTTLERGTYPSLDSRFMHRIESARVLQDRVARPSAPAFARDSDVASIELYGRPGFEGRTVRIDEDTRSLAYAGFGRRVLSAIVNDGRWQVCTEPGYQGYCRVLEPGQYADLGRMAGRVESVRRVG